MKRSRKLLFKTRDVKKKDETKVQRKIAESAYGEWDLTSIVKSLLARSRNLKEKNKPEVRTLLLKKEAAEKNLQLFLQ